MMALNVVHVVGARPNFMKAAPVMAALGRYSRVRQLLVHTGQHYDANMSAVFFDQLGLPQPDVNLEVGSASHAVQTAQIMIRLERILLEQHPDIVLVYGDVNSTVSAVLVCAKLLIPVGHVEAGLRSHDRTMPEEINRLLTDQIADLLFTPSCDGDENLLREGIAPHKIHMVGNVMIDTLVRLLPDALGGWEELQARLGLQEYGLVTLHRPFNVDDHTTLVRILTVLDDIGRELPLVFPIHPRTRQQLAATGFAPSEPHVQLVEPMGYLDFLALQHNATLVITDSGGIQEETSYLGVPCLTVRENTERPVTLTLGTNILVGQDMDRLRREVSRILKGESKQGTAPPLWDGRAGARIAEIIVKAFPERS
jgi:UDP-N-acetylglucosamine 2-epimerase (non-hydrolysing)